jgi:hydrogenase maturation protease
VTECLVLGIGNPDRGDDAVGRLAARALRLRLPESVRVVECDGEATVVLAEMQAAQRVWLVDAARSGARVGTIHRIDVSAVDMALPSGGVSSHGFGVIEAIALARVLGVLPRQCIVYAVEAAELTVGAALSPAVVRAVDEVATRIADELDLPVTGAVRSPRSETLRLSCRR